ncbi:MAG: aspartate/glutamate racemase family protein [Candidatus Bathyarchaeales archaeon]
MSLLKRQPKSEKNLIGLIRVATITDEQLLNTHGKIIEEKFPNLKVISRCIENQPKGVYDFESERKSIPKIVSLGKILERENVQAIIVSCANDPGVSILKQEVKVPVIGAGTACASLASIFGTRVGVLGITDFPPPAMTKVLGERLVAYEKPSNVSTAVDLVRSKNAIFKAAERLISQNIDVLALGCTGYSTLKIADDFEKKFNKKVIDPVIASGLYAYSIFL